MTRCEWALLTEVPVSTEGCAAAARVVDSEIVVGALWAGGGLYLQQPSTGAELTLVQSMPVGSWSALRALLPPAYPASAERAGAGWWTEAHAHGWDAGVAELVLAGIARVSRGAVLPLGAAAGEFSPL